MLAHSDPESALCRRVAAAAHRVRDDRAVSETRVYTDGACKGNPGPGGWAWVVPDGPWAAGADDDTTNQRMELAAALDAVRRLTGPLTVVSDSTYVVNCFEQQWWKGWLARGWKNSQRKPVANRDLWEPLVDLYLDRGDVSFEWVKGHAGDAWNDRADRLAVRAAATQIASSGDVPPSIESLEADTEGPSGDSSGSPDSPVRPDRDRRLPDGRLVAVLGHRPPELGGYDDTRTQPAVQSRLEQILAAKGELDDVVVVTGLRQGAEALGAQAAAAVGVPYVAVLPFPDPDARWPADVRRRFVELLDGAAVAITLESRQPKSAGQVSQSLSRRDGWLRKNVDEAIIVWDGSGGWVEQTWRAFDNALDGEVWVVDPVE